ncbi:ABC transporter ATP-binding protein [Amycolatopsis acidiphila]|uniref:ABC transporter ATP-binding protein n=1 Tax=Amycolatopsis acidiphila TaxID=715473 RepID=A0A558AN19_9PSEU|nr:ABC transporter ATP-binding protein [Amycolatopsis acidiphila]TVT25664.1 ABC transporter ATP-binding protein [Amycolatopsis acidiphila]UIJ60421.1 ABC transporter ATP-binding protein [Amycolatopsis acidiphila]GHG90268.1 ABC transporter ATP-binding protein [Amycolatopsis acidiphila]
MIDYKRRRGVDEVALEAEDVRVATTAGAEIVGGVQVAVRSGHILGLLGETGAGKTVTARAILGLLPRGLCASGRVRLAGDHWIELDRPGELRAKLGRSTGLMLQNPMSALDPVRRIGGQLIEAVVRNGLLKKADAVNRATELCERLGLGSAKEVFRLYPHELSGGMSQRVSLAMTLMPGPKLLVVDEPTSALDANLRVEILTLLQSIARDSGTAMVLISHDLGLVSRFCDDAAVLYSGHLAETGPTTDLLRRPSHPYTRTLVSCSLRLSQPKRTELPTVPGDSPVPGHWPSGCYFHPRCSQAQDECRTYRPAFVKVADRGVACHFADVKE